MRSTMISDWKMVNIMFLNVKFQSKIKLVLFVLFTLSLAIAIAFSLYSGHVLRKVVKEKVLNTLIAVGKDQVEQEMDDKTRIFNHLYEPFKDVKSFDKEGLAKCVHEWKECQHVLNAYNIFFVHRNGAAFGTIPSDHINNSHSCHQEKWYKEALRVQDKVIWNFSTCSVDGETKLAVSKSVHDESGQFVGAFAMITDKLTIFPALCTLDTFTDIKASIIDSDSNVVSFTDEGGDVSARVEQLQAMHKNYFFEKVKVGDFDWELEILVPKTIVRGRLDVINSVIICYIFTLFILYLGVAIFVLKRFSGDHKRIMELCNSVLVADRRLAEDRISIHDESYKEIHRQFVELAKNFSLVKERSLSDPLTGICNRRVLDETLKNYISLDRPFALLLFDIDNFKRINDNFGHTSGDAVVKRVTELVYSSIRHSEDIFARYGGDEFAVVLNTSCPKELSAYIARLNSVLSEMSREAIPVTVSGGVAIYKSGMSPVDMIDASDKLLYRAKESGKNRILLESE